MGNIIENDQFKANLQEMLYNKKIKKTLKIIYKEKQGQLLSVQSCEVVNHYQTIRQRLDYGYQTLMNPFDHLCKIILDVEERKRYFVQCKVCNSKMTLNQKVMQWQCSICKKQTQYKCVFCLRAKIIDMNSNGDQDTYKAVIFEEASHYLSLKNQGISAKKFSKMSLDSQNNLLIDVNKKKSNIVHLLQLQYVHNKNDFKIKTIFPQQSLYDIIQT